LRFEPTAIRLRATVKFGHVTAELLRRSVAPALALEIRAARARVLAADPSRADEAGTDYRQVINAPGAAAAPHVEGCEAFLDRCDDSPERRADRRWLLEWRVDHAPEGERVRALLAWAAAEQGVLSDKSAAAALYARVLQVDPDHEQAAAARTQLLRELGDLDAAARLLTARRDSARGAARTALELELAELLLGDLGRRASALEAIGAVLE